jgi:hypothetical protein
LADYDRIDPISQTKRLFVKLLFKMADRLKPLFSGLDLGLEKLAQKAAATVGLTASVQAALPEIVRPHVVSAVRRGDDLVVIVDSAAWSARVRYAAATLKERLQAAGETVAGKVRVRVGRSGQ